MYNILITDRLGQEGLDRLQEIDDVSYEMMTHMSKEELLAEVPDYDGLIVRSGTTVDADILAAGKKLKVVGRAGIGVDNIDVPAATQHGVLVMNTPRANSVATAEMTMALMLAVCRNVVAAHKSLESGEWRRSPFAGKELMGKTLGVIGLGYIGRLVTRRAQAFAMKVVAYDPHIPEVVGTEMNVTLLPLEEMLGRADIVTLHATVTPGSRHIINAQTIPEMKEGAILVNVARGALVDAEALAEALCNGKLAAAALDVYEQEPPSDNPLIGLPNVVHTPHLGASSKEAQTRVAVEIVEQMVDALRGTEYRNVLNRDD